RSNGSNGSVCCGKVRGLAINSIGLQRSPCSPVPLPSLEPNKEKNMKRTFRLFFLLILTVAFGLTAFGQNTSRETLRDQIQARRAELAALEKEFLAPTAEDRSDFAGLLSEPNTGVIRLLPREKYDDQIVKNKPTISMRGGGAYYSFKRLTHEYGRSDIELNSGELS